MVCIYNENGRTFYAKGIPAQIIHSKRRVEKPREFWKDGVRDDGIMLLGTQASETNAKD